MARIAGAANDPSVPPAIAIRISTIKPQHEDDVHRRVLRLVDHHSSPHNRYSKGNRNTQTASTIPQ